jgi:hypothetical protein
MAPPIKAAGREKTLCVAIGVAGWAVVEFMDEFLPLSFNPY